MFSVEFLGGAGTVVSENPYSWAFLAKSCKRREFIKVTAGAAVSWPLVAHAQQRMPRIGVIMNQSPSDGETQTRSKAFLQELQKLGWSDGRNVRIEFRWDANTAEGARKAATELVALAPDVILASGVTGVAALRTTRNIPIVFAIVPDPVGAGFVESLARPGGNVTGFMQFEYSLSGKWVELLKEIAPGVTRAAVLRDANISAGIGQFAVIQAVAPSIGVDVSPVDVQDAAEIERRLASFARLSGGGIILTASPWATIHRELIATLAAHHKLPSVSNLRAFVTSGGLVSYGANLENLYQRAAGYVDRILKGEKPADLPVQAPTKYELVVNLKTAKALGLTMPSPVLARADELIE
jgi:putative tryptophan/tyrosine transport system substrate-binding protein